MLWNSPPLALLPGIVLIRFRLLEGLSCSGVSSQCALTCRAAHTHRQHTVAERNPLLQCYTQAQHKLAKNALLHHEPLITDLSLQTPL